MNTAEQPFQFATASYLTRVENQRVHNMRGNGCRARRSQLTRRFFITPSRAWADIIS